MHTTTPSSSTHSGGPDRTENTDSQPSVDTSDPGTSTGPDPQTSTTTPKLHHSNTPAYHPDQAMILCERVATTGQTLAKICQSEDVPSVTTVFHWMDQEQDFRRLYDNARKFRTELLIDEAL